jgi:formate hydrogenlyase transcriptional activator
MEIDCEPMKHQSQRPPELEAHGGQNGNGLGEPPAREPLTHQEAEQHLARMAFALPASGGDLNELVGLLTSGMRVSSGGGGAQLHRAEAQYRALVEQIPAVTFMAPLDGSTSELYVSPQIEELLGFSAQEWLEDPFLWYRQLHPEDQVRWTESFASTCFSGERFRAEFRFLARDGRVVWVHGEAKLVMDEKGVPSFLHGVAFDITERKRAEEATLTAYDEIRRLTDQLRADNVYLQEEIKLKCNFGEIVGQTPAIQRVLHQVEQVAGTSSTVLLEGETGTGKELLARAIHSGSPRRARPMLTLNGAALPSTLIESELFGHEKGAYTGALTRQIGRFEQADGSTLFLDEIGELPLEAQVKLLRVLQYGQFERLGSTRTLSASVRIIAASNRDLETLVKEGRFREDLYYRLNVFPIRLPALRERVEDIPLLAWSFVREFGRTMGRKIDSIPRETMEMLKRYNWPGNIRELRNVIERAMIVTQGPLLQVELPSVFGAASFTQSISPDARPPVSGMTLDESQRCQILTVLERTGWRVSGKNGAAAILGLKPTTLESRMAKLGIKRAR